MAKKKPRVDQSQTGGEPFNNALAGLAALRDQLGPGETSGAEVAPPERSSPESPEGEAAEPTPPPTAGRPLASVGRLVVRKERKGRGGKTVTRVDGLPNAERSDWARTMAKALGCGATVEDGSVILQGSQSDRVADWLRGQGARRVVVGDSR